MKALRRFVLSILFLSVLFLLAGNVHAVVLSWDPSGSPTVAGYRIYMGTESRVYDIWIDVGNVTEAEITDLPEAPVIYFAATAYDADGRESDYSEEVVYKVPDDPATGKPVRTIEPAPTTPAAASSAGSAAGAAAPSASAPMNVTAANASTALASDLLWTEDGAVAVEIGVTPVDSGGADVLFSEVFQNPVVVTFPMTHRESDAFRVRTTMVDAAGAWLELVEPDGADGIHGREDVAYLVVDAGSHLLEDGRRIEAGRTTLASAGSGLFYVPFSVPFESTPVVFVQAGPDSPEVSFQVLGAGPQGFWVGLVGPDGSATPSGGYDLSYVAMSPGAGTLGGTALEAGLYDIAANGSVQVQFADPSLDPPDAYLLAPYLVPESSGKRPYSWKLGKRPYSWKLAVLAVGTGSAR